MSSVSELYSDLSEVLKQNDYSLTQPRKAVFSALSDTGPISMSQLVNKVRSKTDRASVYRTIELYEKLGIVNRLQIGWKYKLELSDKFTDHHHHATCIKCGSITSLEENDHIEMLINQLTLETGFSRSDHTLEIKGVCKSCATVKTRK